MQTCCLCHDWALGFPFSLVPGTEAARVPHTQHLVVLCSCSEHFSAPCVPWFCLNSFPPCTVGSSRAALCFPETMSCAEKGAQVLPQQILGLGALSPQAGLTECPKVPPVPVPACASCLLCLGVPGALFSSCGTLPAAGSGSRGWDLPWGRSVWFEGTCAVVPLSTSACVSLAG